jgi:hypothetical protein
MVLLGQNGPRNYSTHADFASRLTLETMFNVIGLLQCFLLGETRVFFPSCGNLHLEYIYSQF